jgi:hypothetical protein
VAIVGAVETSSPNLPPNRAISAQWLWAAGLLQLQHQPPLPCRLDARRRGVHWRCLEAVGEENRPWLCCSGGSMSCEGSIQHKLVAFCAYCCSQNGPQNKLLKLRMGNIKIHVQF